MIKGGSRCAPLFYFVLSPDIHLCHFMLPDVLRS